MKLLFEKVAKKVNLSTERLQKYKDWIGDANKARNLKFPLLDARMNQYDKAEELISFYTFAPLELRRDKEDVIREVLSLVDVNVPIEGKIKLTFEKQFKPPDGYLAWLKDKIDEHPVRYIREQGKQHTGNHKRLETNTHVDVVLESAKLLILIEMKFTSDISVQTTFNANRNQLARMIDVGISEVENSKGKKLVVLLCTPYEFFAKKSRFFYYKIQEYVDSQKIAQGIGWRKPWEIEQHLLKIDWLSLEKVIEIMYQKFESPEFDEAMTFFEERKLLLHSDIEKRRA